MVAAYNGLPLVFWVCVRILEQLKKLHEHISDFKWDNFWSSASEIACANRLGGGFRSLVLVWWSGGLSSVGGFCVQFAMGILCLGSFYVATWRAHVALSLSLSLKWIHFLGSLANWLSFSTCWDFWNRETYATVHSTYSSWIIRLLVVGYLK